MAVIQSTYSENIDDAVNGMLANANNEVITKIVEETNGIGFGVACSQGTADNQADLGASAATGFIGISVRDRSLVNESGQEADEYQDGQNIALLVRGEIWVTTGGAVNDGDDVTFNSTTGVLSSAATSGSQFAITGARWMTTASSGGLARVRLGGALPSA